MAEPGETTGGIFASLRRLLKTLLGIFHNRLELLLVEMQEWRWQFLDVLALGALVLMLALMTLMVGTAAIVVVCVRADRLDLVVGLMLVYLAATIVSFWRLRSRLKRWAPFSATLAELKKDKACLEEKS
jgi:uncharacterized membrane protein YqjE